MVEVVDSFKRINKFALFSLFCLIVVLITYLSTLVFFSEDLYLSHFGEQYGFDQIQAILDIQYKYQWLTYIILPFIYLIKFSLLSLVLLTGAIFWDINISFKKLFKIALIAEFLFIIPSLIKLFWFLFIQRDFDLLYLQSFYPLSFLNLLNTKDLPQWLLYPLQVINVFEIIYWFLLAYGITLVAREKFAKMLGLVASSYGVGLVVWVVFVTFITISLS